MTKITPTKVLNVFVDGERVSPALYEVTPNGFEFTKPMIDLFPVKNKDENGKPVFWVVVEYEYQ